MLKCYKECKKYEKKNEDLYAQCVENCIRRVNKEKRRSLIERIMDYIYEWAKKEYERGYWRI